MEFAVKETGLHQEELETCSVSHPNVIELYVLSFTETGTHSTLAGPRRCYQMMLMVTGEYGMCLTNSS